MRKFIFMSFAVLVFAASAAATSASAASTAPNKAPLIIAMRDPGCHWFYVGGGPGNRKYVKSLTRSGPVTLLNLDEATLIVKGPGRHQEAARRREADAQHQGHLPHHDGGPAPR